MYWPFDGLAPPVWCGGGGALYRYMHISSRTYLASVYLAKITLSSEWIRWSRLHRRLSFWQFPVQPMMIMKFSDENQIKIIFPFQWFSLFLLDIYINHGWLLLLAYMTVWDGPINAIYIQIILPLRRTRIRTVCDGVPFTKTGRWFRSVLSACIVLVMFVLSWFFCRVSWRWWARYVSMF